MATNQPYDEEKEIEPRKDLEPRRDIAPRRDIELRKDLKSGSRPPPSSRPQTGALSIFFIMGLVITAAFVSSGGSSPVDPNGPGGPPTLEPYFNSDDYGQQEVVVPTSNQPKTQEENLQLKTFNVQGCGQKTALYFVIDTSGSMQYEGKLEKEKAALKGFVDKLGGKSVVGIVSFSKDVEEEVPLNYLKDNKKDIENTIKGFKADGWTRTRSAMEMARDRLKESIELKDFPGYRYSLILMTDGVPEIPNEPRFCYKTVPDANLASGIRCFAREEDPQYPLDLPEEIERLGVDIYSINIYSPSYPSDKALYPDLKKLLQEVASDPVDSHYYESIGGNDLDKILNKICDPTNEFKE